MKPNIFEISTKELSQDAFLTWLLQWADNSNAKFDINLNKCANDFVVSLIKKEIPEFDEEIICVKAGRQWNNIDVWAEINNKYLIIIEDKIYTSQHSGQLARYRKSAVEWCENQNPKFYSPICIYLKTGNESLNSLNNVKKEGFKIYNRKEFINLLEKHDLANEIYNDFKARLLKIEQFNNDWENKLIKNWNGNDWQGFYQFLEKEIKLVNWNYVNNPNGGFWSAVLNWDYYDIYPIYLQTEESKLCFKISTDPGEPVVMPENVTRSEIRNKISNMIITSAKKKGIEMIRKPERFGNGKYMTVAIVDGENWLGNKEEKISKEKVAERLINFKQFLKETIN